jgi:hypothetical protein
MKKVIGGALYNTETACRIGTWDNGLNPNDFNYVEESLYRTKSGKYFLHGEGGGNSQYGEWHGNSGSGGEEIRPYTPAEAMEWAQENLDADDYAAAFGEPAEAAEGREALNISLPRELKQRLEKMRSETGKSISQLIEEKFR